MNDVRALFKRALYELVAYFCMEYWMYATLEWLNSDD